MLITAQRLTSRRSGIKSGKRIVPFGLAPSLKTLLQKTVSGSRR